MRIPSSIDRKMNKGNARSTQPRLFQTSQSTCFVLAERGRSCPSLLRDSCAADSRGFGAVSVLEVGSGDGIGDVGCITCLVIAAVDDARSVATVMDKDQGGDGKAAAGEFCLRNKQEERSNPVATAN